MADRTLIIIKPDGVQRHMTGAIISRFERKGFKLVAAKFMQISEATARAHYAVHEGKPFFEGVVKYIASCPVMVMVWQADGIIEMSRKMMWRLSAMTPNPARSAETSAAPKDITSSTARIPSSRRNMKSRCTSRRTNSSTTRLSTKTGSTAETTDTGDTFKQSGRCRRTHKHRLCS